MNSTQMPVSPTHTWYVGYFVTDIQFVCVITWNPNEWVCFQNLVFHSFVIPNALSSLFNNLCAVPRAPYAAASMLLSLLFLASASCLWYILTASSISFILIKTSPILPKARNFPKRIPFAKTTHERELHWKYQFPNEATYKHTCYIISHMSDG